MATDYQARLEARQKLLEKRGARFQGRMDKVNQRLISRGIQPKVDLNSSQGLYNTALGAGNPVAGEAGKIMNPEQSTWGKIKSSAGKGLSWTLDKLSRTNYASATAVHNLFDRDKKTTFTGGLKEGITGKSQMTYSDVFKAWRKESGQPEAQGIEKINDAVFGFAADILLDPLTYLTFGFGAGAKVGLAGGSKVVLSKAGTKFVEKAATKGLGSTFGREFVERAVANMAEKSPALYGKFIDQGGIKYFGKTIVSSGRIAAVTSKLPLVEKVDRATEGTRNAIYSLFNRDASAKFGKLPEEYVKVAQKYRDQGLTKEADAIEKAMSIAQANNLNAREAEMITNALENGTKMADERLENARQLFERELGSTIKEESRRGIQVGDLKNYVPHILADIDTRAIPFKPEGVRVSLGASKARKIGKVVEETDPFMAKLDELNIHPDDLPEDLDRIAEYKAKIEAGEKIDPIKLIREGDKMFVEDGKHRLTAFREAGKTEIEAVEQIKKVGKLEDAQRATIKEINDAFGQEFFDPNIVSAAATRMVASARATTAADFIREVAQKFGAAADYAPSNYVSAGAKELKGFKFHPAIAEQIDTFKKSMINDEATGKLLQAFDKVQNLWKASVTSIFPAFHGRNAISNVFLNFLDIGGQALNPVKHTMAVELLNLNRQATKLKKASLGVGPAAKKAKGELEELLSKQIIKGTDDTKGWTFGELQKAIKDNRVAFGNEYTGFLDIRETTMDKLKKLPGQKSTLRDKVRPVNPLSQDNLLFKAGRKTGQMVEEQARLVNFMSNLAKTGDVEAAAARTKQFLFDYANLSPFEKNVLRRLVPFYTFTRKNLELQVRALLKTPGKQAINAKLFKAVSSGFSGGTLTEDEKKNLPKWMQEGLGIVIKRDGDKVELITSLGTPIEAMFSTLKPNALLGSVSPTIAVPVQVAIGKHFFFDKDLKDVNDATAFKNAPQFIKDYIGYTTRENKDGSERAISLNPTRMFIIQNIPPSSRVVSVIGQLEDENVSGKLKLMRQLTGLKPYGKDLTEEELYREKEKIKALQDLLDKSGVAPIFKRSFIPKDTTPRRDE